MQKSLLILKMPMKIKKNVEEIKNRISDSEDRIKKWMAKKKKNPKETLEIINKIIDYNKDAQNFFHHASKVDKKNQN